MLKEAKVILLKIQKLRNAGLHGPVQFRFGSCVSIHYHVVFQIFD